MRPDHVRAEGADLRVLRAGTGDRPTVLFVNAVGMPAELVAGPAAGLAAAGYDVVTWDLRGSPGPARHRADCDLDVHVEDAVRVMDALGVRQAHLLGWCTGASLALLLARRLGPRALGLVAADGAYLFDGVPGAPLGNAMYDMCGRIVADPGTAGGYHELTRPRGTEAVVLGLERAASLVPLLTLPYGGDEEALVRYAFAIRAACAYDPVQAWRSARRPALLIAHRDDRMVSYRQSVRAAGIAAADLYLRARGGHYGLFADDEVMARVVAHLRTTGAAALPAEPAR